MTLYVFDKDAPGKSVCNGQCAVNWSPLKVAASATQMGDYTIIAGVNGIVVSNVTQFGSSAAGGITNSGTLSAGHTGILVEAVSTFSGGIANRGTISATVGGILPDGISTLGGGSFLEGNAAVGSNNVTATTYGSAAGMEYRPDPNTRLGFALAGSGLNWGLAQNLGTGRSDAFQAGVYARSYFGPAYVSAALAFGNNWFTTNRTALGDQFQAQFTGQSYAARADGGYRFAAPVQYAVIGITPYAALQTQWFHTPTYSETDLTGGGLGLSYNASTANDTRSELGTRFDDLTAWNNSRSFFAPRSPGRTIGRAGLRSMPPSSRCPARPSPSTERRCRRTQRRPRRARNISSRRTGRSPPSSTASSPPPRRLTPARERCATRLDCRASPGPNPSCYHQLLAARSKL